MRLSNLVMEEMTEGLNRGWAALDSRIPMRLQLERAGVAIQCEERAVNPACAPHYLSQDFTRITPTHYLLEVAPLSEARYMIEAALPGEVEAKLLGINRRDPCLVVKRITYSRGVAVTSVKLTHPGVRYQLQGSFSA